MYWSINTYRLTQKKFAATRIWHAHSSAHKPRKPVTSPQTAQACDVHNFYAR